MHSGTHMLAHSGMGLMRYLDGSLDVKPQEKSPGSGVVRRGSCLRWIPQTCAVGFVGICGCKTAQCGRCSVLGNVLWEPAVTQEVLPDGQGYDERALAVHSWS